MQKNRTVLPHLHLVLLQVLPRYAGYAQKKKEKHWDALNTAQNTRKNAITGRCTFSWFKDLLFGLPRMTPGGS